MRIRVLAVIYVLVLSVIVYLADQRTTQYLFRPIRNLPLGDKIGHFLLMGFFAFLLNLSLNARALRFWKFNYLLGSVFVLVVVTLEEFSQLFVRGRTFDWRDLVSDYLGIFLFGEIARFICQRNKETKNLKTNIEKSMK
jgi:polysaccharide biosynthesis protein VpsQ